jgi:hypothetical protein
MDPQEEKRGMNPIAITCDTCGSLPGDPCKQVGPGARKPPPPEKLGPTVKTFHAARRRRAKNGELD